MATYQALAISALPKRQAPTRTWDHDGAAALLAVVSVAGATGTDGTAYADEKGARGAANSAKRLLRHVAPDGQTVKSATFALNKKGEPALAKDGAGTFGWAVYLVPTPPAKPVK